MQIQRPTSSLSAAALKPPAIAEAAKDVGEALAKTAKEAVPTLLGDQRLAEGLERLGSKIEDAIDLPWDAPAPPPAPWEDDPAPGNPEDIAYCHGGAQRTSGSSAARPRPAPIERSTAQ